MKQNVTDNQLYLKYLPSILTRKNGLTPRVPFTYQHMPSPSEDVCRALLDLFQGAQSEENTIGVSPDRFRQSVTLLAERLAQWDAAFERRIGLFVTNGKSLSTSQKEALHRNASDYQTDLYLRYGAVKEEPDSTDIVRIMGDAAPSPLHMYAFVAAALHLYAGASEEIGPSYATARADILQKAQPHGKSQRHLTRAFTCSPQTRRLKKEILDRRIMRAMPYVKEVCTTFMDDLKRLAPTCGRPQEAAYGTPSCTENKVA